MKTIDCRGLACPAPVLNTKNAIETDDLNEITVLVDNEAAKENVSRFLGSQNFAVSTTQEENDFSVIGKKLGTVDTGSAAAEKPVTETQKIMVMVATDCMGHGDDELGAKLMASFLKTLKEMGNDLWRLVFVNNGVKLTIEGSNVLPVLKEFEDQGVMILVCGTCLNHFNLLDKKQVGQTTNMLDIVTAMQLADKVINV
ncbi:MAG: sulfurtransferase-like selenium metabolism protein YedF [Deltaproteobacteria bacterium]|nr:sulfurtransferase-like selenium metabolism protein YedF [Deltaproteobacteria bacterium]